MFSREVTARGHLVDSGIMSDILDKIIASGGKFEITSFEMGKTNTDESGVNINVKAYSNNQLLYILEQLHDLGCFVVDNRSASLKKAVKNHVDNCGFSVIVASSLNNCRIFYRAIN